jgi:hypothetical protein
VTSTREALAALGIAAVVAVVGGGAVYAATSANGESRPFGGPPGGPPTGGHANSPATRDDSALHGEYVMPNGANGFRTVVEQTGAITTVGPSAISVRSVDGYQQDWVSVRGTRAGDIVTVTSIGLSRPTP